VREALGKVCGIGGSPCVGVTARGRGDGGRWRLMAANGLRWMAAGSDGSCGNATERGG
jgi:hypothetical protein